MVAKSYFNAAHFAESFQSLDDLRLNGETCDIHLLASNKEIKAHKIVLASVSEYFKNAIYGLFLNDVSKNKLELKELQYEMLTALVDYMYTGKINITSENVYEIYDAADYYFIKFLKEMCLDFMQENLDIDNCVKIWIIANNCKSEKLSIAAGKFIFSNLEIAANTKQFLSLSNEQLLDFVKLWPKHELFDSIITAVLKWATDKDDWEETLINIFKNVPHTSISEDYFEDFLSTNEFIQNSIACNKWIINIYKKKSKIRNLKQTESEVKLKLENEKVKLKQEEAELKFSGSLSDKPIIYMGQTCSNNEFYKYTRRDGKFCFYTKIRDTLGAVCDVRLHKNHAYIVRHVSCERFLFDDIYESSTEPVYDHHHGLYLSAAILKDSMYILGGTRSIKRGSIIDLNTKVATSFDLLHERLCAGVAVNDGTIYLCGGYKTNIVERFDPREGRATRFGSIVFQDDKYSTNSVALSNNLYCSKGYEFKILDLRNSNICVEIGPPARDEPCRCLVSSHGRIYTLTGTTIYEYNGTNGIWKSLGNFRELVNVYWATSTE